MSIQLIVIMDEFVEYIYSEKIIVLTEERFLSERSTELRSQRYWN